MSHVWYLSVVLLCFDYCFEGEARCIALLPSEVNFKSYLRKLRKIKGNVNLSVQNKTE